MSIATKDSTAVQLTKDLIRRPSVSPEDQGCLEVIGGRLAALGFRVDRLPFGPVETNIVRVRVEGKSGPALQAALAERGVLCLAAGADSLRLVTHYDVDDAAVERAVVAFRAAVRGG